MCLVYGIVDSKLACLFKVKKRLDLDSKLWWGTVCTVIMARMKGFVFINYFPYRRTKSLRWMRQLKSLHGLYMLRILNPVKWSVNFIDN